MTVRDEPVGALHDLLDESREGRLSIDEHGSILVVNETAAAMLAQSKRYLQGKPFAAFVPLSERRDFRHALRAAVVATRASVVLHLPGVEQPLLVSMRRAERIAPPRVSVSLRTEGEVTPLAPHTPTQRAISRELDAFFLRFPQAVVGIDRSGRIAFANVRAKSLFGNELMRLGRVFSDGPAEGRLQALAERLFAVAAPLPATQVPLSDGRVLRVSGISARRADPAVMFVEDVTEETRSDRVTRDFVRNAAHQLRTPLTGIAGGVQVLQSGAKNNPEDRDRFLAHIERHTERLTRIARGLLVLARAQSGEQLRLEFVELCPLFEELVGAAEPTSSVEVEIDCPPGLAAFCEPNLIHEALGALLDNAVEHTAEGTIRLIGVEHDGRVAVTVTDTGTGILPEHRERLFEPFYRPQASGPGFGLGLAIAAQAVEAMDGELLVAPEEQGTRFTISLPSARVLV